MVCYRITLFWREIDTFIVTITKDILQIGGESVTSRICHLNIAALLEEHCLAGQTFVPNRVLLHEGQSRHAASDQIPQLLLLVGPILQGAHGDVIDERPLGVFPKGIYLIKAGTHLVLRPLLQNCIVLNLPSRLVRLP